MIATTIALAKMGWKVAKAIPAEVWIVIAVVLLCIGCVLYHEHAVDEAYKQGQDDMTAVYNQRMNAQEERHELALKAQKDGQKEIVDDMNARLAAAENRKTEVKTIVKEVTKYVTKDMDSVCVVPNGFVRVHDAAATSPDPSGELARGDPRHDGEASGIALSEVAATVADNYAECVNRKEVISVWQDWYTRNKTLFEQTLKLQQPVTVH